MERFKKVSEIIKPFVKTYLIPCLDDEYDEPIPVNDIMSGIKVVGDSFYGRDWLVEFETKGGDFGQVRLQKSVGYGTAYEMQNCISPISGEYHTIDEIEGDYIIS